MCPRGDCTFQASVTSYAKRAESKKAKHSGEKEPVPAGSRLNCHLHPLPIFLEEIHNLPVTWQLLLTDDFTLLIHGGNVRETSMII